MTSITNVEEFAHGAMLATMERQQDGWAYVVPTEKAAYTQAWRAIQALYPEAAGDARHPLHDLDEAAWAWAIESFSAGIRFGAALEAARQTLTGGGRICPRCDGSGVRDRQPDQANAKPPACYDCAGSGVVNQGD